MLQSERSNFSLSETQELKSYDIQVVSYEIWWELTEMPHKFWFETPESQLWGW